MRIWRRSEIKSLIFIIISKVHTQWSSKEQESIDFSKASFNMTYKLKPQFEFENFYCCAFSLWSQSLDGVGLEGVCVWGRRIDNQEKKVCLKPKFRDLHLSPLWITISYIFINLICRCFPIYQQVGIMQICFIWAWTKVPYLFN